MKFTDEDRVALYKKAQSYIDAESHSDFRNEVVHALDERADEDLYDRFYTSLAFGTAGMRGVIGGGTNRMNVFMVRKVTQGLADYITESTVKGPVVIAYDSRLYSDVRQGGRFLRVPTESRSTVRASIRCRCSFAVRYLKQWPVSRHPSHNPAKYNGYKVAGRMARSHRRMISASVRRWHQCMPTHPLDRQVARSNALDSVPAEVARPITRWWWPA